MTNDATQPDIAGNRPKTGPTASSDLAGGFYPLGVGSDASGPEIPSRGGEEGHWPATWQEHERWRAGVNDAKTVTRTTLWREVDALGGQEAGGWAEGHRTAISDVLAILERRGFTEHADADSEESDPVAVRRTLDAAIKGGLITIDATLLAPADALTAIDQLQAENAALKERIAKVEASAEVLIVTRHDLMAEVDHWTARFTRPMEPDVVPVLAVDDARTVAQLLDRLAAYMKGQDDRVVALGDRIGSLEWANADQSKRREAAEAARDAEKRTATDLGTLLDDAFPAVRLVNDWATWSDSSLYAYADAILRKVEVNAPARDAIVDALAEIRKVARGRLGDDGFRVTPTYDDAMIEAAIPDLARSMLTLGTKEFLSDSGNADSKRRIGMAYVETVARALGMRKAGE